MYHFWWVLLPTITYECPDLIVWNVWKGKIDLKNKCSFKYEKRLLCDKVGGCGVWWEF